VREYALDQALLDRQSFDLERVVLELEAWSVRLACVKLQHPVIELVDPAAGASV
jgi:hypothetical protein